MMTRIQADSFSLFAFHFLLFTMGVSLPVYSAETATVSESHQVNFTPWRAPILPGRKETDPHPITDFPVTMTNTQADTQFGKNVPEGSSGSSIDKTMTSTVGDFQSVINRLNSTQSGSGRINQMQTEINQNQSQAGYTLNTKFSVSSMTDSTGHMIGQATGSFIGTKTELDSSGKVTTTTCTGTFTFDPVNGRTLTTGNNEIWAKGTNSPLCTIQ